MEIYEAVDALAALAHETRLAIYRHLVQAGADGLPAGEIGEAFKLPGATLSFHLNHLKRAGLLKVKRQGRQLIYSAHYPSMGQLLTFLTENCCHNGSCPPGC